MWTGGPNRCENNRKGLAATQRIQTKKILAERGGFELPLHIDSMEVTEKSLRSILEKREKLGFEGRNRNAGFC
jgi:hypothetical protein